MPVSSKPVEDASVESNEVVLNLSLGDDAQEGEPEEEMLEAEEEQLEEDEIQEGYESSSSPSTTTSSLTWITWFCSLPGHEYFCEVAEEFIEDDFNLTGLSALVPFYKEAMEMVLDVEAEEESHKIPDVSIVESSAELLYGLIHQRFIITRLGLQHMYAKYDASHFGVCPRVYCLSGKLVPCGRSDLPGVDTVKLYCPSCVDMYVPPSSRFSGVDGAFFGTTFANLLFQTYPSAMPFPPSTEPVVIPAVKIATTPSTSIAKVYTPRIYGFKVSERARSGPRMQWLRMRPAEGELEWSEAGDLVGDNQIEGDAEKQEGEHGALYERDDFEEDDDEEEEEEEEEEEAAKMSGVTPTENSDGRGRATIENASLMNERIYRPLPGPRSSPSTTNPGNTHLPRKSSQNSLATTTLLKAGAGQGAVRVVKSGGKKEEIVQ